MRVEMKMAAEALQSVIISFIWMHPPPCHILTRQGRLSKYLSCRTSSRSPLTKSRRALIHGSCLLTPSSACAGPHLNHLSSLTVSTTAVWHPSNSLRAKDLLVIKRRLTVKAHGNQTIFAPSTAPGKSAIAVVRISGPDAPEVWTRMTRSVKESNGDRGRNGEYEGGQVKLPERRAVLRRIVHPLSGEELDTGLVLFFPAHSSLTAEPLLELHLHGSPSIVSIVLSSLSLLLNFRPAERGEFTQRAFEGGKMDLTQVEGLRDLIESETEEQRKLAIRGAGGRQRAVYERMRNEIIKAMSLVEAYIDFGDDANIESDVWDEAAEKVTELKALILRHLADGKRAETLRAGIRLAIFGSPNAGKSSLLNWLAQREASIVSPHPGTTRDVIELSLDFHGFPIVIADTAGLRLSHDEVESMGVKKAENTIKGADLKVCVLSLPDIFPSTDSPRLPQVKLDAVAHSLIDSSTLLVLNKADSFGAGCLSAEHREALLAGLSTIASVPSAGSADEGLRGIVEQAIEVSVKEEYGLEKLTEKLLEDVKARFSLSTDGYDTPLITRTRHRFHLEDCVACLNAFLESDPSTSDLSLAAQELRYAAQALGRVTGHVDVEDILDSIFRDFCIGK